MIIFINGAFGIGKTTVARLLRARLSGSGIFDPEIVGRALQVLPAGVVHHRSDDFQDLPQFRRAAECHAAHAAFTFAERVATENRTAEDVANLLVQSIESAAAQRPS